MREFPDFPGFLLHFTLQSVDSDIYLSYMFGSFYVIVEISKNCSQLNGYSSLEYLLSEDDSSITISEMI